MSVGPVVPPSAPLTLPPILEVLQRWSHSMGMTTRPTTGTGPDNSQIPGVEIRRGNTTLVAFAPPTAGGGQWVVLKVFANIPVALRATISRLGDDARRQLLYSVMDALQANPRTGFVMAPEGLTDAGQIEQISLDQTMRIEDGDVASFNRFADAVQELVNGLVRVGRSFAMFVGGPPVAGSSRVRPDSAGEMFR